MINSKSKEERLKGVRKGASFFGVARTIPKEPEKKKVRYQPFLEIIDKYGFQDIKEKNLVGFLEGVHKELANFYGTNMVSATSKILWLKFRSPVIILDSQAKKALSVKETNYSNFVSEWNKIYKKKKNEIVEASSRLSCVSEYIIDSDSDIEKITKQEWFYQRVFDIYLWHIGSN